MKKVLLAACFLLLPFFFLILTKPVLAQTGIITDEFIQQFTSLAQEAAGKYGSQIAAYEIWNEGDIRSVSSVYLSPQDYAKLLTATYQVIKANSSSAVIVGGLASGSIDYLNQMGQISADGIGVHPYTANNYSALRAALSSYQSLGLPIWVTEFGWEISGQAQADYLTNSYQIIRGEFGISPAVWYCWSDSMNPGFGLIDASGNPKPVYHVFPAGAGVNIDPARGPAGTPTVAQLRDLGAGWVRMVYRPLTGLDFDSLTQQYSAGGIRIILILNQETLSPEIGPGPREPVTISDSSHVCSDFVETRTSSSKSTTYTYLSPTPGPEAVNPGSPILAAIEQMIPATLIGNITLEAIKFPHFGFFTRSLVQQLNLLLPFEYRLDFDLPGDSTLYFRHFVQGQDENGNFDPSTTTPCNEAPQSEVALPAGIWGKLAGAIRGLCGPLGYGICQPLSSYDINLTQPGYSCYIGSCVGGREAYPYPLSNIQNSNSGFIIGSYIERETEVVRDEIIDSTQVTTTKITDTKKIKVLSRSSLPGGSETAANVNFLRFYIPPEIANIVLPGDEAKALTEGFRYGVAFSPVDPGEHPGQYYELRTMRNLWCMRLAELYPGEFPLSSIDPLCPSRNPNDPAYQDLPQYWPKPDDLYQYCHWDSASGGCHYYTCKVGVDPGCQPSCATDPVCESGLCNEFALYAPKSVPGCPQKACQVGVTCHWLHFQKNPDGGYGPCRYLNPDVCVRNGWTPSSGQGCLTGCNPECCQGSRRETY